MDVSTLNFYENFNSSNQSSPHYLAHEIFVKYVKFDGCGSISWLPIEEQCEFVRTEASCARRRRILDYLGFMYCVVQKTESNSMRWVFVVMLACFGFYIFQIVGQVIGKFFCPSLNYTARTLRMSQSLAGATLLSMANTVAGLIIAWTDLMADMTVLYSVSIGAATFQLSVVAGSICIIQPFHLYSPLFVRDTVFFITLITYIQYIMGDESVNVFEILLFYYALFITVVIIDTLWIKEMSRDIRRKLKLLESGQADDDLKHELELLKEEGVMEILIKDSRSVLDVDTMKFTDTPMAGPNANLFRQFIESLNPIDIAEWRRSNCCLRFLLVIRAPFLVIFFLVCPRVDFNRPNHGWSKLLNIINIWSAPIFFASVSRLRNVLVLGLPLHPYITIAAIPLMILAFFTSRTDQPPIYHLLFALHAIWISIGLVRMCALEILSISYSIGITSLLSPSFQAATFNALEGGIGALIANVTLAMRGYPRMGFAACYGAPLFSIPLSFGVRMLYRGLHSEGRVARVKQGSLAGTLYTVAFSVAIFSLIGSGLARFNARRSIGIFRVIIYPIFLLCVILFEFEIIHSHSTYHSDQRVKMD